MYAFKQSSLTIVAMSSYQFLILDQYKAKVKPLFQMTQLCSKVFNARNVATKAEKDKIQRTYGFVLTASGLESVRQPYGGSPLYTL